MGCRIMAASKMWWRSAEPGKSQLLGTRYMPKKNMINGETRSIPGLLLLGCSSMAKNFNATATAGGSKPTAAASRCTLGRPRVSLHPLPHSTGPAGTPKGSGLSPRLPGKAEPGGIFADSTSFLFLTVIIINYTRLCGL